MNRRIWIAGLLAAITMSLAGMMLQAQRVAAQENATPTMADHMNALDDAMRNLRRTARDGDQTEATLNTLTQMQARVVVVKAMEPSGAAQLSGEEKSTYVNRYRVMMTDTLVELCHAEKAVLEGRHADAFDHVRKLQAMRLQGHEVFRVDD